MNSILLLVVCSVGYIVAYHTYGRFLSRKLFNVCFSTITPAVKLQDDIDYVPTKREVVFGHHYASIAGTGPIVGPAIGIIWGWVPALIWIFLGSIFMGAVHDLGALVISMRHQGQTIGEISKRVINPRVRLLFLLVIFFTLWIVVAVFCLVMAVLFELFPEAVLPIWVQIPISIALGYAIHNKSRFVLPLTIAAVALMYLSIIAGSMLPFRMPHLFGFTPLTIWTVLLLIYTYIASVLPVWTLLQPRDFINAYQLFIALALLVIGILVAGAPVVAPAVNLHPAGAPPVLPFLFVTIACGAISGFHCMVSSGTTSKQLSTEKDIQFVGYGSMLVEGLMAVLVLIAVSAGLGMMVKTDSGAILSGREAWSHYYASWAAVSGLGAKVGAFVSGSANLLGSIGIPLTVGTTLMGVFVASFAATTLDSATRIQRYVIHEVVADSNVRILKNRYSATLIAVISAGVLALSQGGGKGGMILWPLFGTSNQLLAGLALLTVTVYLAKLGKNYIYTLIPMVIVLFFTGWAMTYNIIIFYRTGQWHLLSLGTAIMLLECWMLGETLIMMSGRRNTSSTLVLEEVEV